MKIVLLSSDFKPNSGGIAELCYQISAGLAGRLHDVQVVVCSSPPGPTVERLCNGLTVHRIGTMPPPRGRRLSWRLRTAAAVNAFLEDYGPDVIIVGNYNPLLWPRVLRAGRLPYCAFAYGGDISALLATRLPWRVIMAHRYFKRAGRILCISRYAQGLVHRFIGSDNHDKTVVTGCGVATGSDHPLCDRETARKLLGWPAGPTVLTVARLVPHKGIDTTLQCMKLVLNEFPTCRYAIVGDGPFRPQLESLSARLGLAKNVVFLGHVDEATKQLVYAASDLYVMPSRDEGPGQVEGFGISFLEANAYGLAVVGGRSGGIPDAIAHGVSGLLVCPHDIGELAAAVIELLSNPELAQEMASAGRERIRDTLNWTSISGRIEAELQGLVAAKQANSPRLAIRS